MVFLLPFSGAELRTVQLPTKVLRTSSRRSSRASSSFDPSASAYFSRCGVMSALVVLVASGCDFLRLST